MSPFGETMGTLMNWMEELEIISPRVWSREGFEGGEEVFGVSGESEEMGFFE